MIENDKQLTVTLDAISNLNRGRLDLESRGPAKNVAPEVYLASLRALHEQIADLYQEVATYYRERLNRKLAFAAAAEALANSPDVKSIRLSSRITGQKTR